MTWSDSFQKNLGALGSDKIITISYLNTHNGIKLKSSYTCGGGTCYLRKPLESDFSCFDSGYKPAWESLNV